MVPGVGGKRLRILKRWWSNPSNFTPRREKILQPPTTLLMTLILMKSPMQRRQALLWLFPPPPPLVLLSLYSTQILGAPPQWSTTKQPFNPYIVLLPAPFTYLMFQLSRILTKGVFLYLSEMGLTTVSWFLNFPKTFFPLANLLMRAFDLFSPRTVSSSIGDL